MKVVIVGCLPNKNEKNVQASKKCALNIYNAMIKLRKKNFTFLNILKCGADKSNLSKVTNIKSNEIVKVIESIKPHVVHFVDYMDSEIKKVLSVKNKVGFKIFLNYNRLESADVGSSIIDKIKRSNKSILFNKFDGIFPVSDLLSNTLLDIYSIEKKKISVIYNGVSDNKKTKSYIDIKSKYSIDKDAKIVFTNGTDKNKKINRVIKSYLSCMNENVVLFILGDSYSRYAIEMKNKYKHLIKDRKIIFAGEVDEKELESFYHECELYVQLSDFEGCGFNVIEAIERKVPVLVNDLIGILGIADINEQSVMLTLNNSTTMIEALKKAKRINTRLLIKNSWDDVVGRYYDAYQKINRAL